MRVYGKAATAAADPRARGTNDGHTRSNGSGLFCVRASGRLYVRDDRKRQKQITFDVYRGGAWTV